MALYNSFELMTNPILSLDKILQEDGLDRDIKYLISLSDKEVDCQLNFKSNLVFAGAPFLYLLLKKILGTEDLTAKNILYELEGVKLLKGDSRRFKLPFNVFLTYERIFLNFAHRLSAVATTAQQFVEIAATKNIQILDTRKTTPGWRSLEKYAATVGGAKNHRLDSIDCLMIKDNHKTFYGGLEGAWNYFKSFNSYYRPIIAEIHNLLEFDLAQKLGIRHLMLDNFSPADISQAIKIKQPLTTIEISGGVNLQNIRDYLIAGVDAISLSTITYWPTRVDLSFKIVR